MNKLFGVIWIFAVSALVVAPAFSGSTPKGKPFSYLNNQIAEVQGSVSSLQDQVDSLAKDVGSLEERVGAFEGAINNLENQNRALAAEISSYGKSIGTMKAQISGLLSENAWLQSTMETNGSHIDQLQAQFDENVSTIASLRAAIDTISSLESQIKNNTALIQALNEEIVEINSYLDQKQNIVNGFCPSGSAIREVLADGSVVCTSESSGATGISFSHSYKMVDIPGLQSMQLTVSCPSGYIASGGGFSGFDVTAKSSIPNESGTGWDLYFKNDQRYTVYGFGHAACIRLTQ